MTEHRVTCTVIEMQGSARVFGTHSAAIVSNGAEMHVNALGDGPEAALTRLTERFGRFATDGLEDIQRQRRAHGMPPVEWRRCPACDRRRLVVVGEDPTCEEHRR